MSSAGDDRGDTAYQVVSFREYWGFVSLGLFVASLATRQILSLLPVSYRGWTSVPPYAVSLVPILAAAGVLCALLGDRRRGVARIALFANLVVLVISGLLVLAMLAWRYRLF